MSQEFIQEIIQTSIQAIKDNKETKKISEEKDVIENTEDLLVKQKKTIVKKYIEKKIDDPILQLTWVAEDYLVSENIRDKIKDKFVFEKFLEKSNLEIKTLNEMKDLKIALENAETKTSLDQIESDFLREIPEEKEQEKEQENKQWTEKAPEEKVIPEWTPGNFDALPETYKTYINKISSKFPDPKKSQIINFWPIVVQEALKHKETKKIVDKIFAQINKESWRDPKALNDKWEHSIGFMQINKNAGHTWHINGQFYNIDEPNWNIAYGISFLAECIRRSNGNIRRGFNIYNGWANLTKPTKDQYAESIMKDKQFKEYLA